MSDDRTVRMYYGAASGAQRKALKRLREPNVMISYATQENEPWDGIKRLFVDSGGYTLMLQRGEHATVSDYLSYIREHEPEWWAYQDYPCEPDILEKYGRTVEDHIDKTVDRARVFADANAPGVGVPVLQGWTVSDYMESVDRFRDHGILPAERVGIGSVCGRENTQKVVEILRRVGAEVDAELHGFGIKTTALQYPAAREALTTADSLAYTVTARHKYDRDTWREKDSDAGGRVRGWLLEP